MRVLGKSCVLPIRVPNPSPKLDKNLASMGPGILSSVGVGGLSGTRIASQNRSDHGGRKWARNHSASEIARFFASAAAKKSQAASDFWVSLKIERSSQRPWPQVATAARFCGCSDHGTLSWGSRGRVLRHFQTPTLHWIHFSLRLSATDNN